MIKPPNAVERRKSKTVYPISIPAIQKQRSIRSIPRIIIQIRGHSRCKPCLFKVTISLDLPPNGNVIFFHSDWIWNEYDSLSSRTSKGKEFQLSIVNFFTVRCRKNKARNIFMFENKHVGVEHLLRFYMRFFSTFFPLFKSTLRVYYNLWYWKRRRIKQFAIHFLLYMWTNVLVKISRDNRSNLIFQEV